MRVHGSLQQYCRLRIAQKGGIRLEIDSISYWPKELAVQIHARDSVCGQSVGPIAPISAGFGWSIVTIYTSGIGARSQTQKTSLTASDVGWSCPRHQNLGCKIKLMLLSLRLTLDWLRVILSGFFYQYKKMQKKKKKIKGWFLLLEMYGPSSTRHLVST